jgi:amino acid adenylation domain-containing protein
MATVNTPLPIDPGQPSRTVQQQSEGEPLPLVTELIRVRAQLSPHALALASRHQTVTYGDMEAQADKLSQYLISIGVGPEVLVGVCLERGPAMVVAALAILKAGGAYLPLDLEYPIDRLRFMLDDAQAPVLITRPEIDKRIAKGRWKVVDIDAEEDWGPNDSKTPPTVRISAENLAYVIYTSGSTGRPKGVQITHGNLLNLVSWHNRAFSISAADRASQLASLAFDAAVWEIWPYLVAGSSVHFPDDATRVSVEPLRDWLIQERITVSFVPTPLAESLTSLQWPRAGVLRILLTGGDTLHHYPPSDLPFKLVNNYGPTECTVVATSGTVDPDPHPGGAPTIGRAVDNFQVYILDEHLRQVPTGTVGHLHIGGAGLGRGYLNRPDLNAERFIANPFSQVPGDRLYKTGDLARLLPDGDIAFVGRMDEQIKIRGYRIEPEEIATVLDQYSGIRASVVIARDDSGDKRLVAYVVVAPNIELTHSGLQDFLKKYLPDYMVPAVFVRLSSLPMTPSGKIDRVALPAPEPENTVGDRVYLAPCTPTEERVVAILSELLGVEQVSVNDNFFFLGGHSLLGTQLIARTRDAFGVELPLRTVFDFPTAAEISAVIEEMLRRESMSAD